MPDLIDLRSDTVTRPTPAMRAAIQAAEVGDDVFNEDPTVNRLEERVAAVLGKEAALFVPSGTMSNQIGVKAHTQPGDELLCDVNCHIYNYEAGGPAVLSGVTCRTLDGDYGILDVSQLEDKIRPVNDHLVRTRLVCLENTHNRGGGRVYPIEKIQAISDWAQQERPDHAPRRRPAVERGRRHRHPRPGMGPALRHGFGLLQQGAGAPVGSALAGPREFIAQARRVRKLFGGGMRQAGIAAAGAALRPGSPRRAPGRGPSQRPGDRPGHRRHAGAAARPAGGGDEPDLLRGRTRAGHGPGRGRGA